MKIKYFIKELRALLLIAMCCVLFATDGVAMSAFKQHTAILGPKFSPDGNTIVFKECRPGSDCGLGFLDLNSMERRYLPPPKGRSFSEPSYSPDGKSLVVVSHETPIQTQLAIIGVNGEDFREITFGRGCRSSPRYAPDGDKIIFSYSPLPETKSIYKCIDQDVYEIYLNDNSLKKITNFKFYLLSSINYYDDGSKFVFHAEGSKRFSGGEYREINGKNFIMLNGTNKEYFSPIISGYLYSGDPSVSQNNILAFRVVTNEIDGLPAPYNYDVFVRVNGHDRRITDLRSTLTSPSISDDGKKIVFQADKDRNGEYEMMIVNSDGTGLKSLGIKGRLF